MSLTKCRYCNDEHVCHVENAHAALVADLRALCDDRGDFRLSEADAAELRALLDRHAPEEGR